MSVANRSGRLIRTSRSESNGSASNAPQSFSAAPSSSTSASVAAPMTTTRPISMSAAATVPVAASASASVSSSSSSSSSSLSSFPSVRPVSVFIRNLPPSVSNKILMMDLFSSSDLSNLQILRLIVHTDAIGRCAGTAEVIVANDEQARAVLEKYNEQMKFGRTLKLSILEQEAVADTFIDQLASHTVITEPQRTNFSSSSVSFPAFPSSSSSSVSSVNPTFASFASLPSSSSFSTPRGPVSALGISPFSSPPDMSTLGFHQLSNYSQLAVDTEFKVTDMAATRRKAVAAAAAAAAERERQEKEKEKRKRKEEEDSAAKQKRGKLVVTKGKGNQKAAVFRTGSSSSLSSAKGSGLSISTSGGKVVHLSRKRSLPSSSSSSLSDTQERKKPKLGVVKKRKSAPVNPPR